MYIKATKTHADKDGQPVRSHRLVLSQRVGGKVRHRTLLNLGTDYPVAKEKWREVAVLAEAQLHGDCESIATSVERDDDRARICYLCRQSKRAHEGSSPWPKDATRRCTPAAR